MQKQDDLAALPALFGPDLAAPHLNLSRSGFYALARRDELPIPVVRVGSRIMVRRCDLFEFLGVAESVAA